MTSKQALGCLLTLLTAACGQAPSSEGRLGVERAAVVGWYDAAWGFRRPVSISSTLSTQTAYTLLISASFPGAHVQADLDDLRVTSSDGTTPLPFFVERFSTSGGTTSAHIWVKVDTIANGSTTDALYLYTGNATASSVANGRMAFRAYDGFEDYGTGALATGAGYINPGEWKRTGGQVLAPAGGSAWDADGATFASVIWDSAVSKFRMYYQGWNGSAHRIGLAESTDGLSWTRHASNPVLAPSGSGWDAGQVRVPMVWKEGASYKMIYTGTSSGFSNKKIGHATSSNGVAWTKQSSSGFADPTVPWNDNTENFGVLKKDDGKYLAWYSNTDAPRKLALAWSTNLTTWCTMNTSVCPAPAAPPPTVPVFDSGPNADQDSQFCAYSFRYGGNYYAQVPSYGTDTNYAKLYLWRSPDPTFPSNNREAIRVVHTVGPAGAWDDLDSDTPAVVTTDIQRNIYHPPGSPRALLSYYSGQGSAGWGQGLHVEPDVAYALMPAEMPPASGSVVDWTPTSGVSVASGTVRQGARSLQIVDTSTSGSKNAKVTSTTFGSQVRGAVSVWMRRGSNQAGSSDDYDLYLYGDGSGSATLKAVVGLGGNGKFHYWGGSPGAFTDLTCGTCSWAANTWYLLTLQFNTSSDAFNFVVRDASMNIVASAGNVVMGNPATSVDTAMLYTSVSYSDSSNTFADDLRLQKYQGPEPTTSVGSEQTP